jgi:hypothetical protein
VRRAHLRDMGAGWQARGPVSLRRRLRRGRIALLLGAPRQLTYIPGDGLSQPPQAGLSPAHPGHSAPAVRGGRASILAHRINETANVSARRRPRAGSSHGTRHLSWISGRSRAAPTPAGLHQGLSAGGPPRAGRDHGRRRGPPGKQPACSDVIPNVCPGQRRNSYVSAAGITCIPSEQRSTTTA